MRRVDKLYYFLLWRRMAGEREKCEMVKIVPLRVQASKNESPPTPDFTTNLSFHEELKDVLEKQRLLTCAGNLDQNSLRDVLGKMGPATWTDVLKDLMQVSTFSSGVKCLAKKSGDEELLEK